MPFADELIGPSTARSLHHAIQGADRSLQLNTLAQAERQLTPLALRARADLLRDALISDLPDDYEGFVRVIRAAQDEGALFGWMVWPVTSAVASKAVDDGAATAFDDAMQLLAELTGLLTSEFALRILLREDLDRGLATALAWTGSADDDVRRLASEGTRPYLPWSVRVPDILKRRGVTVSILDRLYRDESDYVRRSVANHLNDLSRDSPEVVIEAAERWLANADENTTRLVRHGLRTLVKRGNPGALALLGFMPASVEIVGPELDHETVPFGGEVTFRATVMNTGSESARLSIDYIIHHMKANGAQTGKTFKLATRALEPGEALAIERSHSFRPISTRRYYPGTHAVQLQVNGVASGRAEFTLLAP